MVGIRISHDTSLTACASSTQQMSMPSVDLISRMLCRRPLKRNSLPTVEMIDALVVW